VTTRRDDQIKDERPGELADEKAKREVSMLRPVRRMAFRCRFLRQALAIGGQIAEQLWLILRPPDMRSEGRSHGSHGDQLSAR
jgi:hypothetical protein